MIWAIQNNQRVTATPNQKAICPICKAEVTSKCGSIKVWHWSHITAEDCDSWSEGETGWHIGWKNEFSKEHQEVIIGKHRADIKTQSGKVIELQNSPISAEDIQIREEYYNNMIWVLNGYSLWQGFEERPKNNNLITFRWKHPAKSWWNAKKPIYLDLGNHIILIKKIYPNLPCGGYGVSISREEFLKQFR